MKKRKFFWYLSIIIFCIFTFFPIYWLFTTSLQPTEVLYQYPPVFYPVKNPITNYLQYIKDSPIEEWLLNSLIVCSTATIISTLVGIPGAYSISRFRYRGRLPLTFLILLTQMLPPAFLIIPVYFLFSMMKLNDTLYALMIINSAIAIPISIWFLKGFFDSIPRELEDAALIDGCNRWGVFFKIDRESF